MGSEKILVVDDEKRVLDSVVFFLKREAFEVVQAAHGRDALSLVKKSRFDLVLLDISMPEMDGFEVMDRIFGYDPEVFVIMMTGYATVESAVKALKQGAWDYLKKPFEYADLIKTVKNALTQKRLLDENRAVSAKLKMTEKRYSHMVNNSPDLIYILDATGCFTFINNEFKKVLGYTRNQLIGKHYKNIIHPDDLEKANMAFHTGSSDADETSTLDLKLIKADSAVRNPIQDSNFVFVELKSTGMYIPWDDGSLEKRFAGAYGIARDVTERFNLEEQLRQAQKMEAIGTLAGGIAHDFNNILMGIQGYSSLVRTQMPVDSPEYKKLISIDDYVQAGSEMTRQLLGFAQKNDKEMHVINMNAMLKMSATMFGRTKKDISIHQNLQKNLWNIQVDEGQIKQVLLNLYVNAWQAMPKGGHVYLKTENVNVPEARYEEFGLEKPGAYIKVSVVDKGIGMEREILCRIFDPFFTTKEKAGGTGLGLATAYGIVKSHGGAFRVLSKSGEGSSFSFYLPAILSVAHQKKDEKKRDVVINGKGTILLVDDEASVLEVCSEMLESIGYRVKSVTSGMEAVNVIQKNGQSIDLVILDMIMPEMSGYETFEKIQRLKPGTRVLLSSGYSRKDQVAEMLEKGCNDFISKPFDVAMLSEKISSVFEMSR